MTTPAAPRTPRRRVLLLGGLGALVAVGAPVAATRWGDWSAGATLSGTSDAGSTASAVSVAAGGTGLFTADRLHEVVLDVDDAAFRQALSTFQESGEKTWLEVTVTLDGTTYERAGLRLKGDSTLRRTDTDRGGGAVPVAGAARQGGRRAEPPGRHRGRHPGQANPRAASTRSSRSTCSGAVWRASSTRTPTVRVGDASALRVVLESPGDTWAATTMTGDGLLYKAEATGDYTTAAPSRRRTRRSSTRRAAPTTTSARSSSSCGSSTRAAMPTSPRGCASGSTCSRSRRTWRSRT